MERINQLLELFEEKLEICKIDPPKKAKNIYKIDRISVKKISWLGFLEHINLKLQVYFLKTLGKKPGKKASKKKKELYEEIKREQNVLAS